MKDYVHEGLVEAHKLLNIRYEELTKRALKAMKQRDEVIEMLRCMINAEIFYNGMDEESASIRESARDLLERIQKDV